MTTPTAGNEERAPDGEVVGHHKVGFGEMPTIRWRDGYWPQVGTKLFAALPEQAPSEQPAAPTSGERDQSAP